MNLGSIRSNNVLSFYLLNSFVFLWGFINLDSIYPLSEAILMAFLFFIILSFQSLVVSFFKKAGLVISIFISSGNFFYFNLILNDQSRNKNLVYLLVFLCIYILINYIKKIKIILFFFTILLLSTLIKSYLINNFNYEDYSSDKIHVRNDIKIKSNIFFIGIDGMMSTSMYNKYFFTQSPASKILDSLGFSRYDVISPGQSTLETYAKLFSYKNSVHPRVSHKIINSNTSSFFIETKKMGFKKQFNFISNYFGGDPNNIFDSYYPKIDKPFSFVLYTDERWGWYVAYIIKKILNSNDNNNISQIEMICNQIQSIDIKKNNWVSISHLWLPGHTIGSYNFTAPSDFEKYKIYYNNSQLTLSFFFKRITNLILKKDKRAIIVFYGDHGAYLLKGAINGTTMNGLKITDDLLLYDKKHVQLAVYPSNYLNTTDIKKIMLNPELLFKIIVEK
jgi:hypothetical protein